MMRSSVCLFITLSLGALFNCSGDGGGVIPFLSSYQDPSEPYTQSVGPSGGTVSDPRGVTVEIPAGALDKDTEISVRSYQTEQLMAAKYGATPFIGGAHFEPDGLVFKKPVKITLPVYQPLNPAESYVIWTLNSDNKWEPLDAYNFGVPASDGMSITYTAEHFSGHAAGNMTGGLMSSLGSLLEESSCDSAGSVARFLDRFIRNNKNDLFNQEIEINGKKYVPCGMFFDFMLNCNGKDSQIQRKIGNESSIRTQMHLSYDYMNGGFQAITVKEITVFWRPKIEGYVAIWLNSDVYTRNICDYPMYPGSPGYVVQTNILIPGNASGGAFPSYCPDSDPIKCSPRKYEQLQNPSSGMNCAPSCGDYYWAMELNHNGTGVPWGDLHLYKGQTLEYTHIAIMCNCGCAFESWLMVPVSK
jgi:hypothetical protein